MYEYQWRGLKVKAVGLLGDVLDLKVRLDMKESDAEILLKLEEALESFEKSDGVRIPDLDFSSVVGGSGTVEGDIRKDFAVVKQRVLELWEVVNNLRGHAISDDDNTALFDLEGALEDYEDFCKGGGVQ